MDALAKPGKIVGTIGLPRKPPSPPTPPVQEPPPAASKPSKPPKKDKFALPGEVDLATELAPEHRAYSSLATTAGRTALALKLLEATRGVAETPRDTRQLRLTLAAAELLPEHSPNSIGRALKTFIEQASGQKLLDNARELRRAIHATTSSARLARFTPMLIGAMAVVEQKRAASREAETVKEKETMN
jgi:hypothetical protein